MKSSAVIDKYLQHYAEPEIVRLAELEAYLPASAVWSDVVVIPACNESSGFLRSPPPARGRSLMILVINQTAAAQLPVKLANQALYDSVKERFEKVWGSGHLDASYELALFKDPQADRDILLVDKFSIGRQLPPKGGVGNARKIGADLAACLINSGRIQSQWIRCTDADAQMPETYFNCTNGFTGSKDISALIYPFHHGGAGQDEQGVAVVLATQLYELSLYYYVAAFESAGSPYAFHTIGSTIAIDVGHYAKVRGFPKREAGEDFYLLNKLAKSGKVIQMENGPQCQPIELEARLSDRVPFGTGAAVNQMTAMNDVVEDYLFYDPRVFGLLGLWLKNWPAIWQSQSSELRSVFFKDPSSMELRGAKPQACEIQILIDTLYELKTEAALEHAFKQSKSLDQFIRQMDIWFDAFRSLKLIHALRNRLLPSIPLAELWGRTEYLRLLDKDRELRRCHAQIARRSDLSVASCFPPE